MPSIPPHLRHGREQAAYVYRDDLARPLFVVCRYATAEGKTFLQGRPDANGSGFTWGLGDVEPVLYRLPELAEHLSRGDPGPVYVVEGEKACDYLHAHLAERELAGVVTTSPMGAGKWRDSYTELLSGARHVIVVADRDDVGRDHALRIAEALRPLVDRLEVKQAAIDAAHAGADDHLEAGLGLDELVELELEEEPPTPAEPFRGLSHADVLDLRFEAGRHLIAELVELGTVGVIAGVPETHKSHVAQAIACAVALGDGQVLGRAVEVEAAPVGVFWQDDSRRNEAERVQTLSAARELPRELPVRWHLNEGLVLPRDIDRLRATVELRGYVLVVLDSFYNFVTGTGEGISLKDEAAAEIVVALKREVSDATGCTVLIVDHAPWPSESNRGQRRAYGSVLKSAAIRWAIFLERQGSKLYVSASGNNIRGLPRTPVLWDEEEHELRLVATGVDEAADQEALEWLVDFVEREHAKDARGVPRGEAEEAFHEAHGGHGRNRARRVITAQLELAETLAADPFEAARTGESELRLARGTGETKHGVYLYPAAHAPSPLAVTSNGESGEKGPGANDGEPLAGLAGPPKGGEASGEKGRGGDSEAGEGGSSDPSPDVPGEDESERLAELSREAQARGARSGTRSARAREDRRRGDAGGEETDR
jgi:hypothetical protein